MAQATFTYNGEQYYVDDSTSPPSLIRMSRTGPVPMSTGGLPPELRQQANQALQGAGSQASYPAPISPQAYPPPRPAAAPPVSSMTLPPSGDPNAAAGITVGRDPNDPNKLIWVDRQTGLPAPQPGGAGTPYTTGAAAAAQGAAQGQQPGGAPPPNLAAVQSRILNTIGRSGWTVTGVTDEMKNQSVLDPVTSQVTSKMAPTGNVIWAITGPGGRNDTLTVHPSGVTPGDFDVVSPPGNDTMQKQLTPADAKHVEGKGYYLPSDPNNLQAPWNLVVPDGVPNADEEMKKALDRIDRQQEMTEKQNNFAAGRGYQTDAEYQVMASRHANDKLGQDKLAEDIRQYDATYAEQKRQFDAKQALEDKKVSDQLLTGTAERALTGARTAGQEATTAATLSATQIAEKKLPGELAQQGATLASTQEAIKTAQQARQIAGAPQLQTALSGATSPYLTQTNPLTGQVTQSQQNLNYQPKTQAEIAARVGQLKSLIDAKNAELMGKVSENYSSDQAMKDYQSWYADQIAPQRASLNAALEQAAFERGKDEATMRQQALQQALGAGNQVTSANQAQSAAGLHQVGPGFAQAAADVRAGKMPDLTAFQVEMPTFAEQAQKATQEALKYIDPRTAAAAGAPPPNYYQTMTPDDIGKALGGGPYTPGGQQPTLAPHQIAEATGQLAPSTAAPAAPAAPTPPAVDWGALMARQAQDRQEQQMQAMIMAQQGQGPSWTPAGSNYALPGAAPYANTTPQTLQQQYPELWRTMNSFMPGYSLPT